MKMKIREATSSDIPEIIDMYIDLVTIAYPQRRIAPEIIFYEIVVRWIKEKQRVTIVYTDDLIKEIVGFTYISFNNAGGLTETILDAEISYIKEKYRKSRAAYLLYTDGFNYAVELGIGIMTTSTPESSSIVRKRFGAIHTFNHFEIPADYTKKLQKEYK